MNGVPQCDPSVPWKELLRMIAKCTRALPVEERTIAKRLMRDGINDYAASFAGSLPAGTQADSLLKRLRSGDVRVPGDTIDPDVVEQLQSILAGPPSGEDEAAATPASLPSPSPPVLAPGEAPVASPSRRARRPKIFSSDESSPASSQREEPSRSSLDTPDSIPAESERAVAHATATTKQLSPVRDAPSQTSRPADTDGRQRPAPGLAAQTGPGSRTPSAKRARLEEQSGRRGASESHGSEAQAADEQPITRRPLPGSGYNLSPRPGRPRKQIGGSIEVRERSPPKENFCNPSSANILPGSASGRSVRDRKPAVRAEGMLDTRMALNGMGQVPGGGHKKGRT